MRIKKEIIKIQKNSKEGSKSRNIWRFRRDIHTAKYVERISKRKNEFKITKRAIAELSPWSLKMIKAILNHPVENIESGIKEILERGATADEYFKAYSVSKIVERLGNMGYHKEKKYQSVEKNSYQLVP